MKIIHRRDVIKSVARRYNEQYARYDDDTEVGYHQTRHRVGDTKKNLAALDLDTCSLDDVVAAMGGTTGWGSLECDECGKDVAALVRFGDTPDYEARWQDLCADCLGKGAILAQEQAKP